MKQTFGVAIFAIAFTLLIFSIFTLFEYYIMPGVIQGNQESIENYITRNLNDAVEDGRIGCAGVVMVQKGKISLSRCFGVPNRQSKCNTETTLFTVASVSKAAAALGVLTLVQDKVIGLDEPVLRSMKRWRFKGSSDAYKEEVTMRQLLSHTSGITDGFGTGGFPLDSAVQSLPEYLTMPQHTNMGQAHSTIVSSKPGTTISYSTMGYSVIQLVIEDKLDIPFHRFMSDSVFRPIGIVHSSYDINEIISRGDAKHLVDNYDQSLESHPHRQYVGQAGASMKLTVTEFGKLISAFYDNPLLGDSLAKEMFEPQPATFGTWGLGLELFGEKKSIVGHSGGAFPRSGAAFRLNPQSGDAIGIMMAGGTEMIDPYISAWMYWETGENPFDIREVFHKHFLTALTVGALGLMLIFAVKFVLRRQG